MTYNPAIPQATDRISQSQSEILQNFFQLNNQYGTIGDHFEWTAASNNGKHKQATFPDRTATPPTTLPSECSVYGKTTAAQTFPYMRRDGSLTDIPVVPLRVFGEFSTNPIAITPGSLGISAVTLVAVGQWQVTFTPAFADTNYSVYVTQNNGGFTGQPLGFPTYNLKTNNTFEVQLIRQDGTGFSTLLPIFSIMIARN